MELGLVSISFREYSPEELIGAVKAVGLGCIEWGSDVHAPWDDEARLRKIAAMQKEAGITCCSYGTYFKLGKDALETLLPYIRAAKLLGTDILRLWCGTKGSEAYRETELESLYEDCRLAAKIAEEAGVTLCMECHNNTVTDRKESALALMRAVNSPAFRMYWQPNQLQSREENLAYARLLAPYTVHIHVFNWNCPDGKTLEKYPLAEAVDAWKDYMTHFSGEHAMLLEFMPDNDIASLPAEAQALRLIAE